MSGEEQDTGKEKSDPLRLGGMALPNGLLIQGPTHWAAAVRDSDGEIQVASARRPRLAPHLVDRLPFLRGPVKMWEAMIVPPLVRMRLPGSRLPFEGRRVIGAMAVTMIFSNVLQRRVKSPALREGAIHSLVFLPVFAMLWGRDLAAYHGAEHKVIAAHEQGVDPATVPKEHDRCGSNLLVPLTFFSIVGTLLTERLLKKPGPVVRRVVHYAGVAATVEMFMWSDRNHGSPLAEAFHVPGREIQRRFATKEPSPEQLDVAKAAIAEAVRVETGGDESPLPA